MIKPDSAGGSLESVLASIRKSLSEQSTGVLSETPAAPVAPNQDAKPPRRHGLTQRLAGATPETSSGDGEPAADDLSDLLEASAPDRGEPASAAASCAATTPAMEASAGNDPLWFLTRRDEPAAAQADLSAAAGASPSSTDAEPNLTRPEVLRASMPPFFGSSTEAAKPQSAPPPSGDQSTQAAAPSGADGTIAQEVLRVAAAAEAAAARPPRAASPSALNGKAAAGSAQQTGAPMAGGDTPHDRALEAMVLDLLKPMLRQWLDQNMPRLVAQALSEEATRVREGDVKKT